MIPNKLRCLDGEIQYEGVRWSSAADVLKINTFKLQEITVSCSLEGAFAEHYVPDKSGHPFVCDCILLPSFGALLCRCITGRSHARKR